MIVMFKREKIDGLEAFFMPLSNRKQYGVYFYRLNHLNKEIEAFLKKYFLAARKCGIVISGKIPNPDEKQLSYYNEIMGMDFSMEPAFLNQALQKWLPRLDDRQRENITNSLYHTLCRMQESGKNQNMLKNAYIKFMCWFYYKFERILQKLGQEEVPKILYEGNISTYELKMLVIIAEAGCDIVLLQHDQDQSYRKIDPQGKESELYTASGLEPMPAAFSIDFMKEAIERDEKLSSLYQENLTKTAGTNIWMTGDIVSDSMKVQQERGNDPDLYYNMFVRIAGVEDKAEYCQKLFHWKNDLENKGKYVFVLEELVVPSVNEIDKIHKNNYERIEQLLLDMTSQVRSSIDLGLENQMKKEFSQLILEESQTDGENLNRLKGKAVYLICWLMRYQKQIFHNYKTGSGNVLFYFGICKNAFEVLFLRLLSRLPLDVILIQPDLSKSCLLTDKTLFEKKYENSLPLKKFPLNLGDMEYGTVAYHAEQDLTQIMYQDSGMYRNQQYKHAVSVSLQTMYEEIALLWDQEVKYRPDFEIFENKVVLPVITAKISGVKDRNVSQYWQEVKKLLVEDTVLVTSLPFYKGTGIGAESCTPFLKNRKLLREKIKSHSGYRYGIFREEIQEYMLDKLQELLDSGLIKGTYSQGTEYTILSVVLGMNDNLAKMLQKFDFTKKLPKLVFVCTGEQPFSLQDSILTAYLHLAGFDIIMFVPSGYQLIEKNYTQPLFLEHQQGDYMYDLNMPDMSRIGRNSSVHTGILNKILKRGR